MVKSKLIAFTTAFSIIASLGTGFITAQAEKETAEVNKGIELVYDKDSSSETTKVIKAYYKGADVIAAAALAFHVDGVEVTDVTYSTEWGGSKQFNKTDLANGNFGFSYSDTEASEPTTDKLAMMLTLTVAEDVDFKLTMTNVDLTTNTFDVIKYSDHSADRSWVNVPAYAAEGGSTPTTPLTTPPVNTYTVTFVADGNTVASETVEYNKPVTALPNASKTGYSYKWMANGEEFTASTPVTADVTVTAEYKYIWTLYKAEYAADGTLISVEISETDEPDKYNGKKENNVRWFVWDPANFMTPYEK